MAVQAGSLMTLRAEGEAIPAAEIASGLRPSQRREKGGNCGPKERQSLSERPFMIRFLFFVKPFIPNEHEYGNQ